MFTNMKQVAFLGDISPDMYFVKLGILTWKNHYCSTSCDRKIIACNKNAFFLVRSRLKRNVHYLLKA